jgi:hypothetical protein
MRSYATNSLGNRFGKSTTQGTGGFSNPINMADEESGAGPRHGQWTGSRSPEANRPHHASWEETA